MYVFIVENALLQYISHLHILVLHMHVHVFSSVFLCTLLVVHMHTFRYVYACFQLSVRTLSVEHALLQLSMSMVKSENVSFCCCTCAFFQLIMWTLELEHVYAGTSTYARLHLICVHLSINMLLFEHVHGFN